MKVVVFGGSGFLGSHVADILTERGFKVTIFDLKRSPYLRVSQEMVVGDILNEHLVEKTIKGASFVYNFSGIPDIAVAQQNPLECVKRNIIGNTIILEGCRKVKIKRFIFASSLYVYSKAGTFYRSTKQACELLIENYNEVFGLPYTILRYGSLYGPRADERNFICKIINEALKNRKIIREGDGDEIREYIHVYDAARGSVDVLSGEFKNQYAIITGNQQMKVKDILAMIKEMFDNKINIEYRPFDSTYHYEITPYTFAPKLAKRIISDSYLDLGQGILKCIQDAYKKLNSFPAYDGLVVKGRSKHRKVKG